MVARVKTALRISFGPPRVGCPPTRRSIGGVLMTRARRLGILAAVSLIVPFVSLVQAPAAAPAPPGDDTPVLLTPKGEHENGEDEAGFDKLRDAYYWSRLLAGDEGGITLDQAAALRSKASTLANTIAV